MDLGNDSEGEEEEEEWDKPQGAQETKEESVTFVPIKAVQKAVQSKSCSGDHSRVIIHIDIDCFYAQVEMIRDPSLKGRPLGIQQKYIIVTCNYVARSFGVKKLSLLKEAKEICPQMIIRNGEDLTHYREMSYKITETIQKYSRLVERLGFDENFVDVTELVDTYPWSDKYRDPPPDFVFSDQVQVCQCGCHNRLVIGAHIAAEIRSTLLKELDITSCAGIAHNKVLAKMIGEVNKPNKQTLMFPCHVDELLRNRGSLRKIPGIGSSTCKKLAEIGVEAIQELRDLPVSDLENIVGPTNAQWMRDLCFGIDPSPVVPTGPPQSISDEDSFRKCTDIENVKTRLSGLLHSLVKRLHGDGRIPQTFRLSMRRLTAEDKWTNRESRQCPIPSHVFKNFYRSGETEFGHSWLLQMALELFKKMVNVKQPFHITLLNVCFTKLQEQHKHSGASSIASFLQKGTAATEGKKLPSPQSDGESSTSSKNPTSPGKLDTKNCKVARITKSCMDTFFTQVSPGKQAASNPPCFSGSSSQIINDDETRKRSMKSFPTESEANSSKRQRTQEIFFTEENIDQEVFSQLPPEIKDEILQQQKHFSVKNQGTPGYADHIKRPETVCPIEQANVNYGVKQILNSPANSTHKNASKKSPVSVSENSSSNSYLSPKDISDEFNNNRTVPQTTSPGLEQAFSGSENDLVPPDMDPEVFKELPPEIRKELVANWKAKQEFSFSPANRSKNTKSKNKTTLLNFFKKK